MLVPVVLVAGVALLVGLFFVFRGGSEEETTVGTTTGAAAVTGAATTTEAATMSEAATTAETATERQQPTTLSVTVRDGTPAGGVQRLTVQKGERVTIVVDSDVDDEVHLHGYDHSVDVTAGRPAYIRFRATIAGRFEIELEDAGTPIAELEVR